MNPKILVVSASPRQNGTSTYLAEQVIERLRQKNARMAQINILKAMGTVNSAPGRPKMSKCVAPSPNPNPGPIPQSQL